MLKREEENIIDSVKKSLEELLNKAIRRASCYVIQLGNDHQAQIPELCINIPSPDNFGYLEGLKVWNSSNHGNELFQESFDIYLNLL